MKLFLDTAVLDEIRTAVTWGILDGVTTNPSLAARAGRDFKSNILAISEIIGDRGTVSAETVATDVDGMIREARLVTSWAPNIIAKIPCTPNGLTATRRLSEEGIRVNMTLVFSVNQALLAMKVGATYVSPFLGRLDDIGNDGMDLLEDIVEIKATYGYETEVLAASIRHPLHVTRVAQIGADIATMPWKIMQQIVRHPLTDRGLQDFLDDWATIGQDMRPF